MKDKPYEERGGGSYRKQAGGQLVQTEKPTENPQQLVLPPALAAALGADVSDRAPPAATGETATGENADKAPAKGKGK